MGVNSTPKLELRCGSYYNSKTGVKFQFNYARGVKWTPFLELFLSKNSPVTREIGQSLVVTRELLV